MKKFLRLSCSICKRTADRLVDNTRFMPDKCTITFKCLGRLLPLEYRTDGQITSSPETGITDWRPRLSTTVETAALQDTTFVNTSCGNTKQVVLAVAAVANPPGGSTLQLVLNQRSETPKNYRQYVYRIEGSFSTVSGVESGLEKKTLRYTTTDDVAVYLNGVKLEAGANPEDYVINDGTVTPPAPPNTIVFNSTIALPGVNQVDVIVSQAVLTTQVTLTFNRNISNEARLDTGSWENVDQVLKFNGSSWVPYYVFTMDLADATGLTLNTILTSTSSVLINGSIVVPASNVELLIARAPYSTLDRYMNLTVPLTTLTFERDYFKYSVVNGAATLEITSTSPASVFPILRAVKFSVEDTIQTALDGVEDQIVLDGSVIVGPDA